MKQRKPLRRRSHGLRNAVVVMVLIVAAIATIIYVGTRAGGTGTRMLVAGDKAPAFTLAATNGGSFNLADYLGKSDVLLFFNEGLTCSPCLRQMVDIDRDYSAFSQMGITVVSITTNSMSEMRAWAQNNGITRMMVLPDPSLQVDQEYGTLYAGSMHAGSAPGHTFMLIDRDGKVIWSKDYGSYTMYVPISELIASVKAALG